MQTFSPHAEDLAKGIAKKEVNQRTLDGELRAREISKEEYDRLVALLNK